MRVKRMGRSMLLACASMGWLGISAIADFQGGAGLEVFHEGTSYVGEGTSVVQSGGPINTSKWPASEVAPVKTLATLLETSDLNDTATVMDLTYAANANGFPDVGSALLDLVSAIGEGNFEAAAKLRGQLSDLVETYMAMAVGALPPEGQGAVAAPPVNDACVDAITVSIPSSTAGTLVESTGDGAPPCSVCQTTGGVWYKVVGTGNRITASLCNAGTGFDTKLSVYKGSCGSLVCEDGNDDLGTTGAFPYACAGAGTRSAVTWCSTPGTEYYILVHSFSTLAAFQLDLSEDVTACTPPANDHCPSAVALTQAALPFTDTGVVYRQAHDDIDVTCNAGSCPVSRRGVWYTYTPTTATSVIVSTSTTGTVKAFFVGAGCGSLTQVLCNNTAQTLGVSGLTLGTTYWILIGHNSDFSEPTAAMNVSFLLPPANDNCPDAITVSVPSQTQGTTINSFADSAGTCGGVANANAGVWYRVIGTGNTMTADTCAAGNTPPAPVLAGTRISVYTCGCPCKTCVAANDTASPSCTGFTARARVSWCSEVGKEYLILVHQDSTTQGNFRLDVSDNGTPCAGGVACTAPANDECGGAGPVFDGANAFTNAGACVGTDPKCTPNLSADVWYDYVATCTGDLTVDTCGPANNGPDTVLQVYNGCACPPSPSPIFGCNDDTPGCGTSGFASRVTVPVSSGNCYKIRLANWSSTGASFSLVSGTLQITCVPAGFCGDGIIGAGEQCDGAALGSCVHGCTANCTCQPPANDDCANAVPAFDGVNLFNRADAAIQQDGPDEPNPPCDFPFGADGLYADVWFDYVASCTGRLMVDTCEGAALDTRLAIYPGCSCPVSGPLACNDDSGSPNEMTDPDQDPDTCNQSGASPYESATRNQVVEGQCYKIRVGSYGEFSGQTLLVAPYAGVDELFIQCINKGSCCDATTGACTPNVIASECNGTLFVGGSCELESCCLNGTCTMLAANCCSMLGGTPGGPGSSCGSCGDGIVGCGEQCDPPGACCNAQCQYEPQGTPCRASAGVCDVAESCTGTSGSCPPDGFATGGVCRPSAGVCDVAESCNGGGPNCPPDGFSVGNECRASTGPCDPAESCLGNGPACPPDITITMCISGDGCCPAGCHSGNDNDCAPAIPTVSEWGLAVLTLIGLVVGTILFSRRQSVVQE